jgi:hypothetical protein
MSISNLFGKFKHSLYNHCKEYSFFIVENGAFLRMKSFSTKTGGGLKKPLPCGRNAQARLCRGLEG